jgi:hypothetical protein
MSEVFLVMLGDDCVVYYTFIYKYSLHSADVAYIRLSI